ncbi:MAG TPA: hypothetical protein VHC49_17985 [Mycobacteriales bacterium]|nr:hypothetical protein [Mycobacteriales bacterium]
MNPTSAAIWRRAAVQPVLAAYANCQSVDAVMMSGSTARGDADDWSDVEVGVFWSAPPTLQERESAAGRAGAAHRRMVNGAEANPPWYDHLFLAGGLMIEVVHSRTDGVEEMLDRILRRCVPDPPALDAIKGIVDGREVRGVQADVVARWQDRAAQYPRGLAIAVIEGGAIEQFWRWRMLVDRNNPLLIAREFSRIASQLLTILHALNGRYCGHASAFKRLDSLDLPLAPGDLAGRLRGVFTLSTAEGAETLRRLVEETFDLIEAHLPEVDVERLRQLFRADRKPLAEPAGGSPEWL